MSTAPKIDLCAVTRAVTVAASVNREGLKALLAEYGATRASAVPEYGWPAVVDRCRAMLRAAGVAESAVLNVAPAKKLREAPRWFIAPPDVASHPAYGVARSCHTFGPNLLPGHGIALVIGPPKSGKSTWLVDRLFKWRGREGEPLRTVWLALESQGEVLRAAASFELAAPGGSTVQVVPLPGAEFDLLDKESIDSLAAEAYPEQGELLSPAYVQLRARVERPDILVLDSLARGIGGADENTSGTMAGAVAGLEHLRRAFNAKLVIAVHHTPKGQTTPRGHGALLAGVDGCALLTLKGNGDNAVVTVRCEAARAFEGGKRHQYRRRVAVHEDLVAEGGDLPRLEFQEITDAPAPTKAPTAASAAPPTRPAEPALAPKPPAHPAIRLRGRAAACWGALGLAPGGAISLDEAKALCTAHACFVDVPPGRVANRWTDVVGAWQTAGLADDKGMVRNPTT